MSIELIDTDNVNELEDMILDAINEQGQSYMTYEIRLALLNVSNTIQKDAERQRRERNE